MNWRARLCLVGVVAVSAACNRVLPGREDGGADAGTDSDGMGSADGADTGAGDAGDGAGDEDESSEAGLDEGGSEESGDDGIDFVQPSDVPHEYCDPYDEEPGCEPGEKCTPFLEQQGWGWDFKCLPMAETPIDVGGACPGAVGGNQGEEIDACVAGASCVPATPQGDGVCRTLCVYGDECLEPERCIITGQVPPYWCYPPCNPLDAEACPDTQLCTAYQDTFICRLAAEELHGLGEPCGFVNVCEPGLRCVSSELLAGCEGETGCCTPFCDVGDPEGCVDAPHGSQCVPIAGVPDVVSHVGSCMEP